MASLRSRPLAIPSAHLSVRLVTPALLLLCLMINGCSRSINSPREVTELLIEGLRSSSTSMIDTLVDWKSVALRASFVTESYFNSQDNEGKEDVAREYRELFFTRYLPLLGPAEYRITQVGEARGDAESWMVVRFPENAGGTGPGHEMAVSLKYYRDRQRWMISDLGDLARLGILDGRFDPRHFYLQNSTSR